jgi:hypothetical protein
VTAQRSVNDQPFDEGADNIAKRLYRQIDEFVDFGW